MCYDIAFKAVFTGEENILAKLVSSITGIDYWDLKDNLIFETNEIPISKQNEKAKRCDFILRLSNKNVINLEINTSYYSKLSIKNLSYICGLYSISTKRGEDYDENFVAVQINLNCYEENKSKALEEYLLQEVTSHKVYTNNLSIFNLNVVKCNDIYYNCDDKEDIPNYIKWGALIYTRDINKIPDIAEGILTQKEMERIMDKIENLNNDSLFMSELEAIKWQERKEKCLKEDGVKEGYALGLEHGLEQGLESGYNKGIVEKTNEIIFSMIKNNMSLDDISKIINKPIEEIKEIIKEN